MAARHRSGSVRMVNKNLRAGLGVLLILMGLVWTLQGLGVLQGSSPMTGETLWAVIGPIVALIGVIVVARAVRGPQPR